MTLLEGQRCTDAPSKQSYRPSMRFVTLEANSDL